MRFILTFAFLLGFVTVASAKWPCRFRACVPVYVQPVAVQPVVIQPQPVRVLPVVPVQREYATPVRNALFGRYRWVPVVPTQPSCPNGNCNQPTQPIEPTVDVQAGSDGVSVKVK